MVTYLPFLMVVFCAVVVGVDIFKALRRAELRGADVFSRVITAGFVLFIAARIPWQTQVPLWAWYVLAAAAALSVALAVAKRAPAR